MREQNDFCSSLYQMGFEPMQLALAERETASLVHSDTDTGGVSPFYLVIFLDPGHLVRNTG